MPRAGLKYSVNWRSGTATLLLRTPNSARHRRINGAVGSQLLCSTRRFPESHSLMILLYRLPDGGFWRIAYGRQIHPNGATFRCRNGCHRLVRI
jgi:hypothetical protein